MADNIELKKEEIYDFKPFYVSKYKIKFQNVTKLTDVSGYFWYTPAMLYLWGKYSDVQLSDLIRLNDIKIFWYKFDKPIFRGFTLNGDPSWNHALWAAESNVWEKLVQGLLETAQFDIEAKRIYRYALQTFDIYDPLFCDKKNVLDENTPKLNVNAFAVLTNEKQYAFDIKLGEVAKLPQVTIFKPNMLHVEAAKDLFATPHLTSEKAFARYKQILVKQHQEILIKQHQEKFKNNERN